MFRNIGDLFRVIDTGKETRYKFLSSFLFSNICVVYIICIYILIIIGGVSFQLTTKRLVNYTIVNYLGWDLSSPNINPVCFSNGKKLNLTRDLILCSHKVLLLSLRRRYPTETAFFKGVVWDPCTISFEKLPKSD